MSKHSGLAALLKWTSLALGAAGLLLFQTGAYAFLNEKGLLAGTESRSVYYSFWIVAGAMAVVTATLTPGLIRQLMPLYVASAAIVVVALLYPPFGVASTSLALSSYVTCVLTTLAAGKHGLRILRLGAAIAAITSGTLIAEMFFPGLLSTTAGRSAGLLANPNVAAVALLLGGTATAPFVAPRWRGAFAVLIAAGIFSTVSRTSILVMFGASLGSLCIFLVHNRSERLSLDKAQLSRMLATAVLCLGLFLAAWQSNSITRAAVMGSASTSLTAFDAAEAVSRKADPVAAAQIVGQTDSGAARIVLMENSIGELTLWGRGAEHAHSIAPHNQYIFFAVAYGVIGVLLISGLLIAVLLVSSSNMLFVLSFAGILIFTHDLTVISITTALAVGCAGGVHAKAIASQKRSLALSEDMPLEQLFEAKL